MKLLLSLLKAYWPQLLLAGIAMVIGYGVASVGYISELAQQEVAFAKKSAAFDAERQDWLNEKIQTVREQNAALASALALQKQYQEKADQLSNQLAATKKQLADANARYQKEIVNATKNDGVGYTGIGPNGLCLYQQALGYPCDQPLPPAASGVTTHPGNAANALTGLSPADLLAHAGDYGAWCQQLKAQLEGINQFYKDK